MKKVIPEDIEIAYATKLKPIKEIADQLGVLDDELEPYGKYIAKINLSILKRLKDRPNGKFITVTAISPTPLGEGKTVTSIGLGQAFAKLKKRIINTLRQPSKGPTFGIKGSAYGGGYSQVLPMVELSLNFTGDIHATESAHNLLNAAVDAHILHGNKLNINPFNVLIRRCVDLNDRALRHVVIGLGGKANGYPRETGFDITVATETAAIHSLATGLADLRARLGRMICGFTYDEKPVTAEDLKVAGAMTALMKDSIKPNLCQSTENHPIIVHGFPFANVAHGNNSVLANFIALKLADYVITESGFGADCGAEKLINVVCRQSGLKLDAVVITLSIRALKMHGGAFVFRPGMSYESIKTEIEKENMPALEKGCENLKVHIENMLSFGIPVVVTINKFTHDTDREIKFVMKYATDNGAYKAALIDPWAKGGEGCIDGAKAIIEACEQPNNFRLLYPDDIPLKEKIEILATKIYRARKVEYSAVAEEKLKLYEKLGYGKLAINMAKTQYSISHNPEWKGAPKDYVFPITDVRLSAGAGFVYPLAGNIMTMPGLPSKSAFMNIDVDIETERVVGIF